MYVLWVKARHMKVTASWLQLDIPQVAVLRHACGHCCWGPLRALCFACVMIYDTKLVPISDRQGQRAGAVTHSTWCSDTWRLTAQSCPCCPALHAVPCCLLRRSERRTSATSLGACRPLGPRLACKPLMGTSADRTSEHAPTYCQQEMSAWNSACLCHLALYVPRG